jgi:hypothetical protein
MVFIKKEKLSEWGSRIRSGTSVGWINWIYGAFIKDDMLEE